MNTFQKKNNIIAGSFLLVLVFTAGLLAGKGDSTAAAIIPDEIENPKSEQVTVDFERFWEAWQLLEAKYPFEEPTSEDKLFGAISGLTKAYDDPYTVFFPPKEAKSFSEDIGGEFSGVGMEVGLRNGVITIIAPLKGTPAEQAGLLAGDIIYKIDGTETADLSIDGAVQMIRGPRGTDVELTIFREGEFEPLLVPVTRDIIEIPTLETRTTEDGIFVLELYNFIGNVDAQFEVAMQEFANSGATELILDLRNNPGGFLQSAINISSWFLPIGEVIVNERTNVKGEEKQVYRSLGKSNFITRDYSMAILINGGSASASEIVAGALAPLGTVTLVGEQTFGKGSVQELVALPDGTSLKVTVAKWYTPDGTSISDSGLTPDTEVEMTAEDYQEERDPQYDKAIEILLEKRKNR